MSQRYVRFGRLIVRRLLVVAVGVLAGSSALAAQEQPDLATIHSLACHFSVYATVDWLNGSPQGEVKTTSLSFTFSEINADEGTAEVTDLRFASDSFDIVVRASYGALHLMQVFREGPIYVTTVFPYMAKPRTLYAVHSRHEYTKVRLPGYTSRPEQYYGTCEIG